MGELFLEEEKKRKQGMNQRTFPEKSRKRGKSHHQGLCFVWFDERPDILAPLEYLFCPVIALVAFVVSHVVLYETIIYQSDHTAEPTLAQI